MLGIMFVDQLWRVGAKIVGKLAITIELKRRPHPRFWYNLLTD